MLDTVISRIATRYLFYTQKSLSIICAKDLAGVHQVSRCLSEHDRAVLGDAEKLGFGDRFAGGADDLEKGCGAGSELGLLAVGCSRGGWLSWDGGWWGFWWLELLQGL